MRYGFFDGPNREYVIERPDTPRAWSNYLGSRKYGGIITAGPRPFHAPPQPVSGCWISRSPLLNADLRCSKKIKYKKHLPPCWDDSIVRKI